MDLKKNGFWIACGAGALVAVLLYVSLVVMGVNAETAQKEKKLGEAVKKLKAFASIPEEKAADPVEGLPVREVVEYWVEKRKALEKEIAEIERIYREKDRPFEKIFAEQRGQVELARFGTALESEIENQLKRPYKALFQEPFEKVLPVNVPPPQREDEIPFTQKKFYIAKELLEAAREGKATRVVGVTFKEPEATDSRAQAPGAAPPPVKRIETEARLHMPATMVAKFVSKLLRADVPFEVKEMNVAPAPFSYPEHEIWKTFDPTQFGLPPQQSSQPQSWLSFPREVFIAVKDTSIAELAKKELPPAPEPPVEVRVVFDALDFDFPEREQGR